MSIINQALKAIKKEIEAVRERPSSDVLFNGELEKTAGEYVYSFETQNQGLRFAEEVRAKIGALEFEVHVVEYKDKKVRIEFPSSQGKKIDEVQLDWENDFVLRRMEEHLKTLKEKWDEIPQLQVLLQPAKHTEIMPTPVQPLFDEQRNEAQKEAIRKAMENNILYIWGPPGTGKTATLGFIMANLLRAGHRVLFVSNTNRAVDVGLLSVIEALKQIEPAFNLQQLTRFGEAALNDKKLEEILFEHQIIKRAEARKSDAINLSATLNNYKQLQETIDDLMRNGEEVPPNLDLECQLLGDKVARMGGPAEMQDKIEQLLTINERAELKRKQLVATTMAKVCTSELFYYLSYDAVVVDEASMAGLPFLMLMAAKSSKKLIIAGDPMQLPPIALTDDAASRDFLEQDIFTYVSGTTSAEALFKWHDENPSFTCFFDVQYRLSDDLAGVISSVFYEGRLKSDGAKSTGETSASVAIIDSSKYNARLEQEPGEYGFRPVNPVHQRLIEESLKKLLVNYPAGDIGIIVPFRNSVYKVRSYLWEKGIRDVETGTIHTFQGREKAVIIFDTVMSGEWQNGGQRHYSVRPFDENKNGMGVPRLLNVAFSRSKNLLVIIADMQHVNRVYGNKFLGKLLQSVSKISK